MEISSLDFQNNSVYFTKLGIMKKIVCWMFLETMISFKDLIFLKGISQMTARTMLRNIPLFNVI